MSEKLEQVHESVEAKMQGALEALKRELSRVRTGRANPSMLDSIYVDYYGSRTALNQVANISVPESQMIIIVPWEKSMVAEIEKAILKAGLGITPQKDGPNIRLPIPSLNEERRRELVKKVKKVGEEAKTSVRNARRDGNAEIKTLEKNKNISEDQQKTESDIIQKITDGFIKKVDLILVEKEKELMEV